jgi:hypothetical protein
MRPIVLLLTLLALAPGAGCSGSNRPGAAAPAGEARPAARAQPQPAGEEEMERYAEREQRSAGLEKFEGGRLDTTALIIILLLVIVIILIV